MSENVSPVQLPSHVPTAAPISVLSTISEKTPSPLPIMDDEILNFIPLSGENPDVIHQIDISSFEPSSKREISPGCNSGDKENTANTKNKTCLKYNYKKDQWSPLNPEGKKQYDRDFLLQLQSQPMSLCKLNNLPNLSVIKDKAHIQKLTEVNRVPPPVMNNPMRAYDPFMPGYARGGPMPRMENDKLKRSVQGVLDKLAAERFEILLSEIKSLNINTEEKLTLVVNLIFEKAINKQEFTVTCAILSKHLALIKVPVAGTSGSQVNFRKLLLTKCQNELEQDKRDEIKNEEKMNLLETADLEMQLEYGEKEKKIYRQLGNIRFIGELFKLGMIIEPIMHECIKRFLSQGDEESLECLCQLLKSIGKELDDTKKTRKSKGSQMDSYFNQMKIIVDEHLISSRIRFMLQDVIYLKESNWVPRRDENPKTSNEILREAEFEAPGQQVYQNMANYLKRISDDRDQCKNSDRMVSSEDSWTPSSNSSKSSYSMMNPSKLKLTKPDEVDTILLGPGEKGLSSWSRGNSGGTKTTAYSDKTALTNRFSTLSVQSPTSNNEERSNQISTTSSLGCISQLSPIIRKAPFVSKTKNLHETVKGLERTSKVKVSKVKAAAQVKVNGKVTVIEELALHGPEYNQDVIERKTKPLIDEFLHNIDFEKTIKCVTELASPNTVHIFINAAINQVLERSSLARFCLGQLLTTLLKMKIMNFDQYKKGLSSVLEIIDNYALDIPLIWDYMGEILQPLIEDTETPFILLKEALKPCIPSEKSDMLVSSILHCTAKQRDTTEIGKAWRESDVQLTDSIGTSTNDTEFIKKHKLEFTVSPANVTPHTQMSMEEMKKHILNLLEKNAELEEVFDWVDAYISETSGPTFVRALVTTVHESCLSSSETSDGVNVIKLKSRIPLISRYVSNNEKLQLQALYAIQALTNQLGQPSGLLHEIFNVLYDADVIFEESFKEWEQSDDPNEAEGKGAAVHSVKSFFTWLREPENEDNEEISPV